MKQAPRRAAWTGVALLCAGLAGLTAAPGPPDLTESHPLLPGTIVMWSGSVGDLPDGWRLCDGSPGTPDLRDRFVLGALPGRAPGEVGGANELVLDVANLPSHGHELGTSLNDSHEHTYLDRLATLAEVWSQGSYQALGAQPSMVWTETTTSAAGSHVHQGEAYDSGGDLPLDNRPAFARLAYLIKDQTPDGQGVPKGAVLAWTGPASDLPEGYALCDGTLGTPDLTDRFVQSVGDREQPGETGGAHLVPLGLDLLPIHGHELVTDAAGEHAHGAVDACHPLAPLQALGGPFRTPMVQEMLAAAFLTEVRPDQGHATWTYPAGAGAPIDKRPAFASVVFAMRTGPGELAAAPSGVIAMWAGKLDRIPDGWSPCDGEDGRPDLQDRFLVGATEPGATGGAHALTLTLDQMPTHDHLAYLFPDGAHAHEQPDLFGGGGFLPTGAPAPYGSLATPLVVGEPAKTLPAGLHGHTGSTDLVGEGQPFDNRPAFFRVLYLIKD